MQSCARMVAARCSLLRFEGSRKRGYQLRRATPTVRRRRFPAVLLLASCLRLVVSRGGICVFDTWAGCLSTCQMSVHVPSVQCPPERSRALTPSACARSHCARVQQVRQSRFHSIALPSVVSPPTAASGGSTCWSCCRDFSSPSSAAVNSSAPAATGRTTRGSSVVRG